MCSEPNETLGSLVGLLDVVAAVELAVTAGADCLADGVVALDGTLVQVALPVVETFVVVLVLLGSDDTLVELPGFKGHWGSGNQGDGGEESEEG